MSVFDFCGTWVEKPDGESLEALMRAMKVRESKILESLSATATQRIWVKGSTLVTAYSSEFGEVASTFALNGGWRVSSKKPNSKQVISRCTYDANKHILLIEKKLIKQGGILRDERRVERDELGHVLIRQRLEFIPLSEEKAIPSSSPSTATETVVANRIWEKSLRGWTDSLLDRLRGVWVLDEEASESLRPIFEAMNLPAGSIRTALAMRTQHSIFVSGPKELLLVNQSLHGDLKSATHPVRELRPPEQEIVFPAKGQMACYAVSPDCVTLLSTSEDGSSTNQDERTVSQDGLSFAQRITFSQAGREPVVVSRRWKRAPNHTLPWVDTLPVASKARTPKSPSNRARSTAISPTSVSTSEAPSPIPLAPPTTPRTVRTEPRLPPTSPTKTPAVRNASQLTGIVKMQSLSLPPSPTRGSRPGPMSAEARTTTSEPSASSKPKHVSGSAGPWVTPFMSALLMIGVCTLARFFVSDSLVVMVGGSIYLLLRSSMRDELTRPDEVVSPWIRTIALLIVATIALFHPSKGRDAVTGEDPQDTIFQLVAFCAWGLSRFYSPSRFSYFVSAQDQWLAISVSRILATATLSYGIPKIVAGNDENEPGLAILSLFPLLAYGWLRLYAFSGAPLDRTQDENITSMTVKATFDVGVDKYRISDSGGFAEYLVYAQLPDGPRYSAWQRYSAFRAFRRDIGQQNSPFPQKRFFGNTSAEVLNSRLTELDSFVKRVFTENGDENFLATSHEARSFVGAPAQ